MKRSYATNFFPTYGLTLLLIGCGSSSSGGGSTTSVDVDAIYDREAMLTAIGTNVISPAYIALGTTTTALDSAIDDYCSAISGAGEAAALTTAQNAWRAAMDDFQFLDAFMIGPAAASSSTIRNDLYSWPLVNYCGVDREVVSANESSDYTLTTEDNRKGLDALEYLLFDSDLEHACTSAVTATANWNSLDESTRKQRRCTYMQLVSADITTHTSSLASAWNADSGTAIAGLTDGSVYSSIGAATNALSDSLFYTDTSVKDLKLAAPSGISSLCTSAPCPDLVEMPNSNYSRQAVLANLQGLTAVYYGSADSNEEVAGFDDYLEAMDGGDFATTFEAKLAAASTFVSETTDTLGALATGLDTSSCTAADTTETNPTICRMHGLVKAITDDLRAEFVSILQLDAPQRVSGDND